MPHTTYAMMWWKNLMLELGFRQHGPMPMHCHNQSVIYIAQNSAFHERANHIKIDCYLVKNA